MTVNSWIYYDSYSQKNPLFIRKGIILMKAVWDTFLYIFNLLSDFLNFAKNLMEFTALIVSVITFFFLMVNKYSKALSVILRPCGLNLRSKMRILFQCRKSPVKKRAFLEFALLRTQGHMFSASDWHGLVNEFKVFYNEHETDLVYSIPNCTLLIDEEFSVAVSRYFTFFSDPKVMKTFGITDSRLPWVILVRIEETYVTPTCLLTGLLSKYEENWSEFIKRYVSSAYISENDEDLSDNILSNELYLTFAWLLWGPSYEIDYQNYWDGLCQLSYGDESNSIPAVVNRESSVLDELKARFLDRSDKRYGTLLSVQLRLCENREFFRRERSGISAGNAYFYDKLEAGDFSFAARLESYNPYVNYKEKKYYCTAYVWLLFEQDIEEEYAFRPEKTVAFFEHANLADTDTYLFLVDSLIEKSLRHFETVFQNPAYTKRKYRFVCGMNDEIETLCMAKYRRVFEESTPFARLLKENVNMTPKRRATEAFAGFDDYFSTGKQFRYQDLNPSSREDVSDLARFYTEIYLDCFPDPNERETFDSLLNYLKEGASTKDYQYHILLLKDEENNILAGAVFDYFPQANAGMIEFIAVKSDRQSAGIGSLLYRKVLATLNSDAQRFRKKQPDYIFCEVDSPEHSVADVKKYLYFWDKQCYRRLNFHYIQPALSASKEPVTGLWLAVTNPHTECTDLPVRTVLQVLHDYMKYAMGIDSPRENPAYIQMEQELSGHKTVDVRRLPV